MPSETVNLWWMSHAWDESVFEVYEWWKGHEAIPYDTSYYTFDNWIEPLYRDLLTKTVGAPPAFLSAVRPSAELVVASCTRYPLVRNGRVSPELPPLNGKVMDVWLWLAQQAWESRGHEEGEKEFQFADRADAVLISADWSAEEAERAAERLAADFFAQEEHNQPQEELTGREAISYAYLRSFGFTRASFVALLKNPKIPHLPAPAGRETSLWRFLLDEALESSSRDAQFGRNLEPLRNLLDNPAAPVEDLTWAQSAVANPSAGGSSGLPSPFDGYGPPLSQHYAYTQGKGHKFTGNWRHEPGFNPAEYSDDEILSILVGAISPPIGQRTYSEDATREEIAEAAWELLRNPAREQFAKEVIRTLLSPGVEHLPLVFLLPAVPAVIAEMREDMEGADKDVPFEWLLEVFN